MFKFSHFTKRYIFALSIIASLSTLAYFNLRHLLDIQLNDGKMVNISSSQRMLSQQIALYAIYYQTKDLVENTKVMEGNHALLMSSHIPESLNKLYFEEPTLLDERVRTYLYHAERFYDTKDGRSLTYILQNSKKLLPDLDKAVALYVETTEANTQKLQQVEFFIFILTLVTLFFEAIFIFRPANIQIMKDTEEIIREKDYSNAVIESSTNAIITLDADLKIRTYNTMAESIFGYKREEMIGFASFEKIIPQKYKATFHKGIFDFLKTMGLEHKGEVQEIEAINKEGEHFPIRISFGSSGQDKGSLIVASIQDISKEKLKDKVMQEQGKFAALGEMIAIIAHQWRQPLAQLNFNCMYIRKKLQDPELIKQVDNNEEIIQFMSETITNFQNFYKKTEDGLFHPSSSIRQALSLVSSTISLNQIALIFKIDNELMLYGNANSLAQVVLSMLQNSIDIMKEQKIDQPFIEILLHVDKDQIVLSIKDNAGGIKMSPIEDIFKPFNSQKKSLSTGVGLYMSKLLIETKFHGSIEARNSENGAEFIMIFPKP